MPLWERLDPDAFDHHSAAVAWAQTQPVTGCAPDRDDPNTRTLRLALIRTGLLDEAAQADAREDPDHTVRTAAWSTYGPGDQLDRETDLWVIAGWANHGTATPDQLDAVATRTRTGRHTSAARTDGDDAEHTLWCALLNAGLTGEAAEHTAHQIIDATSDPRSSWRSVVALTAAAARNPDLIDTLIASTADPNWLEALATGPSTITEANWARVHDHAIERPQSDYAASGGTGIDSKVRKRIQDLAGHAPRVLRDQWATWLRARADTPTTPTTDPTGPAGGNTADSAANEATHALIRELTDPKTISVAELTPDDATQQTPAALLNRDRATPAQRAAICAWENTPVELAGEHATGLTSAGLRTWIMWQRQDPQLWGHICANHPVSYISAPHPQAAGAAALTHATGVIRAPATSAGTGQAPARNARAVRHTLHETATLITGIWGEITARGHQQGVLRQLTFDEAEHIAGIHIPLDRHLTRLLAETSGDRYAASLAGTWNGTIGELLDCAQHLRRLD